MYILYLTMESFVTYKDDMYLDAHFVPSATMSNTPGFVFYYTISLYILFKWIVSFYFLIPQILNQNYVMFRICMIKRSTIFFTV